jgi:hypothetical protein
MEQGDIVAARLKILWTVHHFKEFGDCQLVFYLNETLVNQNHTVKYIWQNSTRNGGLKVPVVKGSHLIVCHAALVSYLASGCLSLNPLMTVTKKWPPIHFEIGFCTDLLITLAGQYNNYGQCELPFGYSKQGA